MSDSDFDAIGGEPSTALDERIASLEKDLQNEKDGRNEDRFIGLLIFFIFFDAFIFYLIQNATGPLAILVLEFVFLMIIAKRFGIEQVPQILDRTLNAVTRKPPEGDS